VQWKKGAQWDRLHSNPLNDFAVISCQPCVLWLLLSTAVLSRISKVRSPMRCESLRVLSSLPSVKPLLPGPQPQTGLFRLRTWLSLAMLAVFALTSALAQARDYTNIVVFGDSLSDTGNVAHLTEDKYGIRIPGPLADYTDGRFTDGFDTIPAAQNYFGVWIEQFAASLPSHPEIRNSLDGGTNYAYGFASTGSGTSLLAFGPSNSLSVQVENIGQQITDYLATHPKIDSHTLFVVWGGAIDVLYATSPKDVIDGAVHQVLNIQRLIDAGATQFLVPNLPPLGLVPRFNSSPAAALPVTAASLLFNGYLATGIAVLRDFYPHRHLAIRQLDTFRLLSSIVAAPSAFSLTNATASAQGQFAADPDTYLFWDDLHPTTRGHNILAHAVTGLMTHASAIEAVK
jgi:phospholipase/lecithinase/hemolysin